MQKQSCVQMILQRVSFKDFFDCLLVSYMDNSQINSTLQQTNIIQPMSRNIVLWGIDMAAEHRAELIELLNVLPLIKNLHQEYLLQELCQITSDHLRMILEAACATSNPEKAVKMCRLNRFEQKSSILAKSYFSDLFKQCKSKSEYQKNMECAYSNFVKEMSRQYKEYLTESRVSQEELAAFRFYSQLQEKATSFFIESKRFKIHDISAEMVELTQRSKDKRDIQPPKVKRKVASSLMKLPSKPKK